MADIPRIRFKGFTGVWEQHKWIDTVDISTEMVDPTTGEYDDMPHIAPGNIESFTGRILDNVKSVKEEQLISGKFRFRSGDVVYGKINPQLGKYFYSSIDGLTSADAYVFKGKNGLTQKFLFSLLQTEDFFKYSVSVSKRSGMPKINREELNAYSFFAPEEAEQEQIGRLLLELGNLITLHQRKCEETKELKKYMLKKMFPQNGEKIPEIRFAGFTGDWELRKFGDVFEEYSEKNHAELPPLTIIQGGGTVLREKSDRNLQYDKSGLSGYKMVRKNDFIVHLRSFEGGLEKANSDGIISPAYHTFHGVGTDSRFYYLFFRSRRFIEVLLKPHVYGIRDGKSIDIDGMRTIMIPIPSYEEQKKIGSYIDNLDHLITLHQRKCDQLKEVKKFMLQNMFPQKG